MSATSAAEPRAVEEEAPAPEGEVKTEEEARREALTLLASIFIIAGCGLIYELLIATVSSYLLGSSVTQFSISIGVFIGAMGVGSHLSQRVERGLLSVFILTEIVLGLLGGMGACLLLLTYSFGALYWATLYAVLIAIGALVGLELPLLTRLLKPYGSLRTVIAQALSYDYIGALAGSLMFPLMLLPFLGMARTGFFVGLVNVGVAAWNVTVFQRQLRRPGRLLALCGASSLALGLAFLFSVQVVSLLEARLYEDRIVYAAQTRYQRIVVTQWREDLRLFLDGNLQFSSTDEYRYHEALVHPAMSLAPVVEEALVLGGGDGLAIRELLKYPAVKRITLVDIDPAMTRLGRTFPAIAALNRNALRDPRVRIVHDDAFKFLERDAGLYDVILADLPDPNTEVLAKLYTVEFYRMAKRRLAATGAFVTQATSPLFAREAFWCIAASLREAGLHTAPYHVYVPSFGDWGFVMASPTRWRPGLRPAGTEGKLSAHFWPERLVLRAPTRYLNADTLPSLFLWSRDTAELPVDVSTMDRPVVLQYYVNDWKQWE